jgi:hypothetical protein
LASDEREHASDRPGEHEAHPGGVDDVVARRHRIDPAPGQRRGRDQPERERRRADDGGGGEIGVGEARDAADAEIRREPEREQVAARERDGNRGSLDEVPEPRADGEPDRPRPAQGVAPVQPDQRHTHGDRRVRREPPGERDDAVRAGERGEDDEAGDPAERKAESRRPVAVERGERPRAEGGEQLDERRRDEHDQRARRHVRGLRRQLPGEEVAELR